LDKVLTILRIPVGEACLIEIDAIPGNMYDGAEHIELEEPTLRRLLYSTILLRHTVF